jgi:3-dehydroquinate synthase
MKQINIIIPEQKKQYSIFIGEGLLEQLPSLVNVSAYSKIIIITDTNIEKLFLPKVKQSFTDAVETIIIQPGEDEKNIDTVQVIWKKLQEFGCDRKSLIINLGGGVIGDMGGFAASTYMRGINFVNIPTTLLAAVDASVGGKTGIDFTEIKNLIGTFQQPAAIIIDTSVLKTLPEREFLSGFAEMIKQGLIQDKTYFQAIIAKKPMEFSQEELVPLIQKSCELKASLVMQDEKEEGKRKILNFGHTIGHAIEALSWNTATPLRHGEAVHLGMLVETKISNLSGILSDREAKVIEETLQQTGLPTKVKSIIVNEIVNIIVNDKKNTKGQVNWVLLKNIGEAVYDQQVDDAIVRKAIESIIE